MKRFQASVGQIDEDGWLLVQEFKTCEMGTKAQAKFWARKYARREWGVNGDAHVREI